MTLPWERFSPDDTETVIDPVSVDPIRSEIPSAPATPNLPARQLSTDEFGKVLKDAFAQALREVGGKAKDVTGDFVRDTVDAVARGDEIDWGKPTIEAETSAGKKLVVADARNRSWRTLLQGLGIDLVFAIVAVLATLSGADLFERETWILFAALLIKTVIQTVVAYVMRLKITPTIRTPGDKMALAPIPVPLPESR